MSQKQNGQIEKMPVVRKSFYTRYGKRILDLVFSGGVIILLSPLLLLLAFLELIIHGRPILYAQERPGLHGAVFKLYKFRSMTNETDVNGNLLPGKQRVTAFGRWIRRFSLDELPELFCIFTGKMSFIGPRPLLVQYLPYYTKRHRMRHEVRPGLACVSLRRLNTWSWTDQLENDVWYIENCSFLTDVKEIFAVLREAAAGADYRVNDSRKELTPDYWKE